METWRDFLATYFGWRPTLAQIVWTILTLAGGRLAFWMWHQQPPRGEWMYWLAGFPVLLVFWAAVSYAARSGDRPNLTATIDRIQVMKAGQITRDPEYSHYIGLLLVVAVRNSGTPSIADQWKLSISLAGSKARVEAKGIMIPPNLIMNVIDEVTKKAIQYVGADALYNKTVLAPIPTGAMVRGLMLCFVDGLAEAALSSPGTQYHLSFIDILGKRRNLEYTWPAVVNRDSGYIAGLAQAIDLQATLPLAPRNPNDN